jgi:hypothetical protein
MEIGLAAIVARIVDPVTIFVLLVIAKTKVLCMTMGQLMLSECAAIECSVATGGSDYSYSTCSRECETQILTG